MKLRWSGLAVLTLLPMGAALADYADQSQPAVLVPAVPRSVAHESFLESAQQSVQHATQTERELAIALQNARRDEDMMLATCLEDAFETARKAQTDAIKTLATMSAAKTEAEARALGPDIMRANQAIMSATQNATRCESGKGDGNGVLLELDADFEATLDPGSDGPGADLGGLEPPVTSPPAMPPTVDVMEPGTDLPPTPPTASPMR